MVFQQKHLEKAYFNVEMTGPAMVRPWSGRPRSSDFLKERLVQYQIMTD